MNVQHHMTVAHNIHISINAHAQAHPNTHTHSPQTPFLHQHTAYYDINTTTLIITQNNSTFPYYGYQLMQLSGFQI